MVRSGKSQPGSGSKGSGVEFKDFNFKLAVIDELMYERGLLGPKFDIREFAKTSTHRNIDVETEGYDVIPEARDYFAQLALTPEQLATIDHLAFDAGGAIYGQIIPFWDGEDERFDIESLDDVAHLPNLKRVDMISLVAADADLEPLRARGIATGDDVGRGPAAGILRDFIADEESALEQQEQGGFYPENHHRIYPAAARAGELLDRAERVELYFHLLRVSNFHMAKLTDFLVDLNAFELVCEAYRRVTAMLEHPGCMLGRLEGVFLFGFDENGTLPSGTTAAGDLARFEKVLRACDAFGTIPSMLKRIDRFRRLAADDSIALRVVETFRHISYLHNGRRQAEEENEYYWSHLRFWGFCLVALANAGTASLLVDDLMASEYQLPSRSKHLALAAQCADAAGRKDLATRLRAGT